MRTRSAAAAVFGISLALSACSSSGGDDIADDDDDDTGGADAAPTTGELPPPAQGFQIITSDITLAPGEEATYCYYTTIDVDTEVGVKRWESRMTPGSHHLIMYFTSSAQQPDGTVIEDCSPLGSGGNGGAWTFASSQPDTSSPFPEGVGMAVKARQPAIVQMHYLNASDLPLVAHAAINGHTFDAGESYQKAAAYITYNTQIDIPAGATGEAGGTCAVPSGAKFFMMSTHSHQYSTLTRVTDGGAMVMESDNWEHPDNVRWDAAPFHTFASGSLTYHCEYFNSSGQTVQTGDSAATDEMCMAVGYFFPADKPVFCLNSFVVPL